MFGAFNNSFIEYCIHGMNLDCNLFIVGLGLQKIFLAPRNLKDLFRSVSILCNFNFYLNHLNLC